MTNHLINRKNKSILTIFEIIVVISGIYTFIVCLVNIGEIVKGFNAVLFLPVLYLLFFLIIVQVLKSNAKSSKITVSIYLVIQWLRMVLLPLVGILSGYFSFYGSHVNEDTAELSVFLLIYEFIISCLFCCIILHFKSCNTEYKGEIKLKGTNFFYIAFVLIGIALFFSSGAKQFQFFALKLSEERVSTAIAIM